MYMKQRKKSYTKIVLTLTNVLIFSISFLRMLIVTCNLNNPNGGNQCYNNIVDYFRITVMTH